PLLVRQLDVEADGQAAALAAAAVCRLHDARPSTGDDGPACLGEQPAGRARRVVRERALVHARRPEDRHRRPVEPVNRLEAGEELVRDRLRVRAQLLDRLVRLQHPAVGVHSIPFGLVARRPSTIAPAMPAYRAKSWTARARSGANACIGTPPSTRITG